MNLAGSSDPPFATRPGSARNPTFRGSSQRNCHGRAWGPFDQFAASEQAHVFGNGLRGLEASRV